MDLMKSRLCLSCLNIKMFNYLCQSCVKPLRHESREFSAGILLHAQISDPENKKEESIRMKQFHKKLKLQPIPRVPPKERFVDLVLVETDPSTGELISDPEKDPTKWGDWQNGGRVSDF